MIWLRPRPGASGNIEEGAPAKVSARAIIYGTRRLLASDMWVEQLVASGLYDRI